MSRKKHVMRCLRLYGGGSHAGALLLVWYAISFLLFHRGSCAAAGHTCPKVWVRSSVNWTLASRRRAENQPRLVFLRPLRGLKIPRAFSPTKIPICCAEGGFFQNVADVSIAYQILGTHVAAGSEWIFELAKRHDK